MSFENPEFGSFSLSEAEKEKIKEEAKEKGNDPEEAVKQAEERVGRATAKVQSEKMEEIKRKLQEGPDVDKKAA